MEITNKIPTKNIEIEIKIKLLEYLKRNSAIDDGMYNYIINKLVKQYNYQILT